MTGRDLGASVLLSSGTGTGQLDFTSGVVKGNVTQIDGVANGTHASGMIPADVRDIAGSAVSTSTAQLGVNVVSYASGQDVATRRGTAQTGAAGSITLDSGASSTDNLYQWQFVAIVGGTGVGQTRLGTGYTGSSKVLTVAPNWTTNPSSDSLFVMFPAGRADVGYWLETVVATPATAGIPDVNTKNIAGSAVSTSTAQIGVNVVNFGGSAGTFASGRPEVNTTHIAGSAVSTSTAQIGVNAVNIGGTAQTGRDLGASVLLSSGTGTGQLDFTSGVVKSNMTQVDGVANGTHASGLLGVDVRDFGGSAGTFSSGRPEVSLGNVAHGGSSSTLTLSSATIAPAAGGGDAVTITGGAASGATPAGHAIKATGGAASTTGGGTAGVAVKATGGASAASTNIAAEGATITAGANNGAGGADGGSFNGTGNGDGLQLTKAGSGVDLRAGITGDITGNLSGSVGSVTGAVGSVTGVVGSVTGNVGGNVVGSVASVTNRVTANVDQIDGASWGTHAAGMAPADVRDFGGSAGTFSSGRPEVNSTHGGYLKISEGTGTGQLDLASGRPGIDWAKVANPTTTVGLSGTTISTSQAITSVSGSVGSVSGAVGSVTGNVGGNVVGSVASVTNRVTANTDQWRGEAVPPTNSTGRPLVDINLWRGEALPATAATGVPKVDPSYWRGEAIPSTNVTGRPLVDVTHLIGDVVQESGGYVKIAEGTGTGQLDLTSGRPGIDWGKVANGTTSLNLSGTTVSAVSGAVGSVTGNVGGNVVGSVASVTAPVTLNNVQGVKRNTAFPAFSFVMTSSSTGQPLAGLTVTCQTRKDGGSFGSCTNSVVEASAGSYDIDLAASELDGAAVQYKLTATGATPLIFTLTTVQP